MSQKRISSQTLKSNIPFLPPRPSVRKSEINTQLLSRRSLTKNTTPKSFTFVEENLYNLPNPYDKITIQKLTSTEATEYINANSNVYSDFLVRTSSQSNSVAITFKNKNNKTMSLLIKKINNKFILIKKYTTSVGDEKEFDSVEELIDHFKHNQIYETGVRLGKEIGPEINSSVVGGGYKKRTKKATKSKPGKKTPTKKSTYKPKSAPKTKKAKRSRSNSRK